MTWLAVGLGAALAAVGLAKLVRWSDGLRGLATFGVHGAPAVVVLAAVAGLEIALGVMTLVGSQASALAAAGLMVVFAVALGVAAAGGRVGQPCGCFGPRSTVSWWGVARNAAVAAGFVAAGTGGGSLGALGWVDVAAVAALLVAVASLVLTFALAREVATLKLRVGPQMHLDIEGEGPAVGDHHTVLALPVGDPRVSLAVFTSAGCRLCTALAPTLAELAGDPDLALQVFDEHEDAEVWHRLDVPGSPYAVAASSDGTVRAKGTFNNLAQLESLVSPARAAQVLSA